MERSEIRGRSFSSRITRCFAALHPGYGQGTKFWLALVEDRGSREAGGRSPARADTIAARRLPSGADIGLPTGPSKRGKDASSNSGRQANRQKLRRGNRQNQRRPLRPGFKQRL